MLKPDYSLYLVSNREVLMQGETLENAVEKAILGGVSFVQLREKNISFLEFYNLALNTKKLTSLIQIHDNEITRLSRHKCLGQFFDNAICFI